MREEMYMMFEEGQLLECVHTEGQHELAEAVSGGEDPCWLARGWSTFPLLPSLLTVSSLCAEEASTTMVSRFLLL